MEYDVSHHVLFWLSTSNETTPSLQGHCICDQRLCSSKCRGSCQSPDASGFDVHSETAGCSEGICRSGRAKKWQHHPCPVGMQTFAAQHVLCATAHTLLHVPPARMTHKRTALLVTPSCDRNSRYRLSGSMVMYMHMPGYRQKHCLSTIDLLCRFLC